MMAPICLNKSLYWIKNVPINEVERPRARKIIEKPNKNKSVFFIACLLKIPLFSFNSFNDTPVIYERNAGYNGNEQGDRKDNNPAPKTSNKLISFCKDHSTSRLALDIAIMLIVMSVKAVNARKGIVTNPNQLIYWILHGTPLTHGLNPPNPGIFCSR